ncbi:hypothetical protein C0J52_15994 [Blattella germanica]|nr:hypothetical protein C0J52_15994 [Blattella germanica]
MRRAHDIGLTVSKLPVSSYDVQYPKKKVHFTYRLSEFEGFNNETGTIGGFYIVPNIIHYVRFGSKNFSFIDAVCVLSALKNHKPELFIFHTNAKRFVGPSWKKIQRTPGFKYRIHRINIPPKIFEEKVIGQHRLLHATEFTKIKVLMTFGGIVLDNDVYVVKNLNKFRKFEMTLSWEEGACMSTRVLIGNKKARFLKLWYDSFREYSPRKWYYNAGCKPAWEILSHRPELIHRVKTLFGSRNLVRSLYKKWYWKGWKEYYTIPVLVRHASLHQPHYKWLPKFDEVSIKYSGVAFAEMARDVYLTT